MHKRYGEKDSMSNNKNFKDQYSKGTGSSRRNFNINIIVEQLKAGRSKEDIELDLLCYFKPETVENYLHIAQKIIERDNPNIQDNTAQNSATNTCKNCSVPIPDNLTFCSQDCAKQYRAKEETNQ